MLNFDTYSLFLDGAAAAIWTALYGDDDAIGLFADAVNEEIAVTGGVAAITPGGPGWVIGAFAANVARGRVLRPEDVRLITRLAGASLLMTDPAPDAWTTVLRWFALDTAARLLPTSSHAPMWAGRAAAIVKHTRRHSLASATARHPLFKVDPTAVLAGVLGFPLKDPQNTVGDAWQALESRCPAIYDLPLEISGATERTIDMLRILGVIGLAGVGLHHVATNRLEHLEQERPMADYGRFPNLARAAIDDAPLHQLLTGTAR